MYLNDDLSIDNYISIFKRRFFLISALTSLISIVAFFVILFMPSVYEAAATILVEAEQVDADDNNLGNDKNNIAERLESVNAMLFTNEKMLSIAKKYDLFKSTDSKVLTPQDEVKVASLVRSQIKTKVIKADVGPAWEAKPVLAVEIISQFGEPDVTYNITNDVVQAILKEESTRTTEIATGKSKFFEKEALEKKAKLEDVEAEIIAYKRRNANILPENRQVLIESLERIRDDLTVYQKEQAAARADLASLKVDLSSARSGMTARTNAAISDVNAQPYKKELDALKAELSKSLTIYSENHPKVKSLRGKISAIETLETVEHKDITTFNEIEVERVQVQIDAVNDRIKSLERNKETARERAKNIEAMLLKTAQTEGVLDSLDRKYEAAKGGYEKAKAKQEKARIEMQIQLENKGEKFVLLEPPVMPTFPVKPKRKLLLVGAILGGLIISLGLSILLEFFDRRLRGEYSIAHSIKLQPLALVPYIKNKADKNVIRNKLIGIAAFSAVVFVACVISIHLFFMPFSELVDKFLDKI